MTTSDIMQQLPTAEPVDHDWLGHMMQLQAELQTFLYGEHPYDLNLEKRIQYIHMMHTALLAEQHELMDEVGWKPWASRRFINDAKAQGEVIDVLHFVLSEALAVGLTPHTLYHKFIEKQERNRQRQREGYTGVTEKCIICGRDTEDVKVATGLAPMPAQPPIDKLGEKVQYCGECARANWKAPE